MKSQSLIKRIRNDISTLSLTSLSIDKIKNLIFQDKELEYLININNSLSYMIEQKIRHMSLFGDKLNELKKNISILKRSNDENLDNAMNSYETLLDIMIIKAEDLSMLQEKQNLIKAIINSKKHYDLNSSLEIIILAN
jgi:hypothetical protein